MWIPVIQAIDLVYDAPQRTVKLSVGENGRYRRKLRAAVCTFGFGVKQCSGQRS